MRAAGWIACLAVIGVAVGGIGRLRIDTDILGMLPERLPEVRGLRILQDEFSRGDEVVIWLEGRPEHTGLLEEAAGDLGNELVSAGVAGSARWRPEWIDATDGVAELVAYLWLNGAPEEMEQLAARLSPDEIDEGLATVIRRIATTPDGEELAMRSRDPFGLLEQAALEDLIDRRNSGEGFGTEDGTGHLLLVTAPRELGDYRDAEAWLAELREVCDDWRARGENRVALGLTGDPVFQAEIGAGIERDMSGTVMVTSILIGLLFLWAHRRLSLLAGLLAMLALIVAITLGVAGWMHGRLSIVSAGFAAVLIGLAVDYGVLICQEGKLARHDLSAMRRAVGPSIGWAAVTTAAAFAALSGSSLPGIGQLGALVAVGVLTGAAVMLGLYAPLVGRFGAGLAVDARRGARLAVSTPRRAGAIGTLVAILAVGVMIWKGVPGVELDMSLLRPRQSAALETFERIQAASPAWRKESLRVAIEGRDDEELLARRAALEGVLGEFERAGLVTDWWLPAGWWPNERHQRANRSAALSLSGDAERLLAAADEAGFNAEGMALGEAVLDWWGRQARAEGLVFPESSAAREVMGTMLVRSGERRVLVGEVTPADEALASGRLRELQGPGVSLAGWEALSSVVLELVERDLRKVFVPMVLVMAVLLLVVFRRWSDALLVLAGVAFSVLVLNAAMALAGIRWNVLNIAAIPLLLGTGVDYGIHMLLALRRTGGDQRLAWHGTGKAIVFCGVSTAVGFGSLSLASNAAMASMGLVCAIGILINMATAVWLLPGLRRARGGAVSRLSQE